MSVELSALAGYVIPLLMVILVLSIVIAILRNLKTVAVIGMILLVVSFLGASSVKDTSTLIKEVKISNQLVDGIIKTESVISKTDKIIYIGFDAGDEFTAMDVEVELYKIVNPNETLDRKSNIIVGKKYLVYNFENKGYQVGDYKFIVKADGKPVKEQAFRLIS
ncbi:hypothetical protein HZC08_02430 [Candidatus Micrarchaeota archaeon]|nr:hypothetical protein [Candidatus Micrarchaeota archaeon]